MPHVGIQSLEQVGGQAVLGRQSLVSTPWLTERHGYDPTCPIDRIEPRRDILAAAQLPSEHNIAATVR